jgi:hypothetical protein
MGLNYPLITPNYHQSIPFIPLYHHTIKLNKRIRTHDPSVLWYIGLQHLHQVENKSNFSPSGKLINLNPSIYYNRNPHTQFFSHTKFQPKLNLFCQTHPRVKNRYLIQRDIPHNNYSNHSRIKTCYLKVYLVFKIQRLY